MIAPNGAVFTTAFEHGSLAKPCAITKTQGRRWRAREHDAEHGPAIRVAFATAGSTRRRAKPRLDVRDSDAVAPRKLAAIERRLGPPQQRCGGKRATGFDAADVVGVISLVVLAIAMVALYVYHLSAAWRWLYVVSSVIALYLNVFVGVVQSFQKVPFLHPLAPNGSEPPFIIAQVIVMVICIVLGILAAKKFHPVMRGLA
jgi:hypothetical protein